MNKIGRRKVVRLVTMVSVSGEFEHMAKTDPNMAPFIEQSLRRRLQSPDPRWLVRRLFNVGSAERGQVGYNDFALGQVPYRMRAMAELVFIGRKKPAR